jgi:hypothetical protein
MKNILNTLYDEHLYDEKTGLDIQDYLYNYILYPSIFQKMLTSK